MSVCVCSNFFTSFFSTCCVHRVNSIVICLFVAMLSTVRTYVVAVVAGFFRTRRRVYLPILCYTHIRTRAHNSFINLNAIRHAKEKHICLFLPSSFRIYSALLLNGYCWYLHTYNVSIYNVHIYVSWFFIVLVLFRLLRLHVLLVV